MDELRKFIAEMRQQNLPNEVIYQVLINKGWTEAEVSEAFLPSGATVPAPKREQKKVAQFQKFAEPTDIEKAIANDTFSSKETTTDKVQTVSTESATLSSPPEQNAPKISNSEAITRVLAEPDPDPVVSKAESVLHHIFLWLFSIAFIINIQMIIGLIFDADFGSVNFWRGIASSSAAMFITGAVYTIFYVRFAKKIKKNPALRIQGSWTIASIVLGSLTGIIGLIWLIIGLIWGSTIELVIRLTPVILYAGLVVLNYSQINFGKPQLKFRLKLARFYYGAVIILLLALSVLFATLSYFTHQHDSQLKQRIVEIVSKNHQYYQQNQTLAPDLESLKVDTTDLKYKVLSEEKSEKCLLSELYKDDEDDEGEEDCYEKAAFEICANFTADTKMIKYSEDFYERNFFYEPRMIEAYNGRIGEYQLSHEKAGEKCFKIALQNL